MEDDAGRGFSRRALRGVASPIVGYFDRRFQELHDHLDRQIATTVGERFDQLTAELRTTRSHVALDADTIAELAFTLERFADMFTFRMEELAASLRAGPHLTEPAMVEVPFAYAAAGGLEPGQVVAVTGGTDDLAIGLAARGLRVVALGRAPTDTEVPEVMTLETPVEQWQGPDRPLDALFVLSRPSEIGHPTREMVDLFAKWLAPGGLGVLSVGLGPGVGTQRIDDLLADWDVRRRELFARGPGGHWRRSERDDDQGAEIALVEAVPRS